MNESKNREMATRRRVLGAGLSGMGALLLDLPVVGQAQAQTGDLLKVAITANPSTLDPATGRSGRDHQYLYPLYDTLVQWDPKTLEARPGLAQSWEYKDETTLVLELRPGLVFHDGTPLNAEAVKFNLDRYRTDAKSNIKVDFSSVASVEAAGATTVTIKLLSPDRSIPLILADRAGMMASPTAIKAGGGSIDRAPVGAGPWKFVKWDDNALVAYEKNPNYWDKTLPKIAQLHLTIIPEVSTGVRSVLAGQNDIVVDVPAIQKPLLERSGKAKVFVTPSLYLLMIYIDFSKPPFNDLRVRQAMNLAIDRESLNKLTMGGLGEAATTLFPKAYWAHDPALDSILAFNPDKAKALLKAAGVTELTFTGVAYADQAAVQRQEAVLEMWRRVGIKPTLRSASVSEASQAFFFQRSVQSYLGAITARPDPSMVSFTLFGKDSPYNGGRQEIPGMEAALAASRIGATQIERKARLSQVQRIVVEGAYFVPLLFDASIVAVSKGFDGFQPNLMGRPRFERIVRTGK
jgi:ABC-type transport system substrate-binding protein